MIARRCATVVILTVLAAACSVENSVSVPRTEGLPYTVAATRLAASGFRVARMNIDAEASRPGVVIRTVPAQLTRVKRRALIMVYVSAPVLVDVPATVGISYSAARAKLSAADLIVKRVPDRVSNSLPGEVTSTDPIASAQVADRAVVTVHVAVGRRVPAVGTMDWSVAQRTLEEAGFVVPPPLFEDTTAQEFGIVVAMRPTAQTRVARGSLIELVVARPGACDPNYGGVCLDPDARDYDCWPGSGNGPLYVFVQVKVAHIDHYGLDGYPPNGIGCESLQAVP
jgi:eukaryotic-like serine/threonine-protein kinase